MYIDINIKYLLLVKEDLHNIHNEHFWTNISSRHDLNNDFAVEFKNKIFFESLYYNRISEDLIEEFKDRVCWIMIPFNYDHQLSIDFIRKFKEKINWTRLSYIKNSFSEEFVEEFKDKIDWRNLSLNKRLPEWLIRKYKDRLVLQRILRTDERINHLSPELRAELKEHLSSRVLR